MPDRRVRTRPSVRRSRRAGSGNRRRRPEATIGRPFRLHGRSRCHPAPRRTRVGREADPAPRSHRRGRPWMGSASKPRRLRLQRPATQARCPTRGADRVARALWLLETPMIPQAHGALDRLAEPAPRRSVLLRTPGSEPPTPTRRHRIQDSAPPPARRVEPPLVPGTTPSPAGSSSLINVFGFADEAPPRRDNHRWAGVRGNGTYERSTA